MFPNLKNKREYEMLPFLSQEARILPDPGIEPESPVCPALAGGFLITEPPEKPQ